MKAALVPVLAGVLWVGALAVSPSSAQGVGEQGTLEAGSDPWYSTPGLCDCDPCHDPALWGGYCAERAAGYARRRHFWQKVHRMITLGWLPKPHPACQDCRPHAGYAVLPEEEEEGGAEAQQQAQPGMPLPPPPQREARGPRLPLQPAVAARAQVPVLRGHRGSWVGATGQESKTPVWLRLRWPKLPLPQWPGKPQAK